MCSRRLNKKSTYARAEKKCRVVHVVAPYPSSLRQGSKNLGTPKHLQVVNAKLWMFERCWVLPWVLLRAMFSSTFAIKLVRVTFWSFYVTTFTVDRNHVNDITENCTAVLAAWLACDWCTAGRGQSSTCFMICHLCHCHARRFQRGFVPCQSLPSSAVLVVL